jgi:hypothetical protein
MPLQPEPPKQYWFPAKRYGWGWGLPITWQGWAVFVVFFALLIAGIFLFPPARGTFSFLVYTMLVSVAFGVICYAKGEPVRWRWGDD